MHILYIDDDNEDAEIFCEAIKEINAGIQCTVVSDGPSGLNVLSSPCPDFIFIDYRMPRMDGMAILQEMIKHECFKISKIIMYSTDMSDRDIEHCKRLGVHNCMKKSSEFKLLVKQIHALIYD